MASNSAMAPLRALTSCRKECTRAVPRVVQHGRRGMASEASSSSLTRSAFDTRSPITFNTIPSSSPYQTPAAINLPSTISPLTVNPKVTTTLHSFPTLEPIAHLEYPSTHLHLPLRKDILHRAIVFEGDATRQGTANTKWRDEVHGSNKKVRPQKGTGRARLGDKKSPMLRGGGVAFGPKPRDFSTDLPKKIYDLAWRTALSARYRRGELVVVDSLSFDTDRWFGTRALKADWQRAHKYPLWIKGLFEQLQWGNDNGRSFLITTQKTELASPDLYNAMKRGNAEGRVRSVDQVDVKNVLEMGRVVIEKDALDYLLIKHQSDLGPQAEKQSHKWLSKYNAQLYNSLSPEQAAARDQLYAQEKIEELMRAEEGAFEAAEESQEYTEEAEEYQLGAIEESGGVTEQSQTTTR